MLSKFARIAILLLVTLVISTSYAQEEAAQPAQLEHNVTHQVFDINITRAADDGVFRYADTWYGGDPNRPWNGSNISYRISTVAPAGKAIYAAVQTTIGACHIQSSTSFNCNFGNNIPGNVQATVIVTVHYTPEVDWFVDNVNNGSGSWYSYPYVIDPYDIGTEQLVNGGFEIASSSKKIPANWSAKNMSKDKRVCNTETKIVAYHGACSLQLKGDKANKKVKFSQKLTPYFGQAGDVLWLGVLASAKNAPNDTRITLKYSTYANPKVKTYMSIDKGTYGWYWFTGQILLNSPLTSMKVVISNKATGGKVWLDNLELYHIDF